jgi:tetratricopeptide (TPR) repeat protein
LKPRILAEPSLVGREKELEQLESFLESAFAGKGTTTFISGEAGSGKTRLVTEFLNFVKKKEVAVLAGWCLSTAAVPYFPFLEAFDSFTSFVETSNDGQLGLKSWFVGSGQTDVTKKDESLTPQLWRDQTFAAVTRELFYLSAKKPTILIIDDIHWADSASLALLHYVSRAIASERILILATFRNEELNSLAEGQVYPLIDTLRLMGREDLFKEIKLADLNQDDVGRVTESMLGGSVDPDFVEKLTKESRGNPLFIIESLKLLSEHGSLIHDHNQWRVSVDKLDIPTKVKDIILRRVSALKSDQRRVLDVASVIGDVFDPELLGTVLNQDSLQVLETLNAISQSNSLVSCEKDYFRFDHAKSREVVYEEIRLPLRIGYHSRIAEKIESRDQSLENVYASDLAFHYTQAGNLEKAIKYSLVAGREALAGFSNAEALKHFTYILQAISENSEDKNARETALEGLAESYFSMSMFKEAIRTFEQLSDIATSVVRLRALRRAMDAAFFQGDFAHLLELTKKTEAFVDVDRLEHARVLMNRGRAVVFLGNYLAGRKDFEDALQIFEEEGSLPDMAITMCGLGGNGTEKGLARALHSVALYAELGDDRGLMGACFRAGQSFAYRMLNKEALEMYAKAVSIGKKIGNFNKIAETIASSSWTFEAIGDWSEALSRSLEALDFSKKTNSDWVRGIIYSNLIRQYSVLGDIEHAQEFFEKIQKLPPEVISDFVFVRFRLSKAVFLATKGRWPEVLRYFEGFRKAMAELGSETNPSDIIINRQYYEWILCKQNKIEEAKTQIHETQEMTQKVRKYFENTIIQPILLVPRQVEIEKTFTLRIHVINVSKNPVQLSSIEGIKLEGLKVETMPDYCNLKPDCINMNGKKLDAFQVELIKFNLSATIEGIFNLNPKLIFTDNLQKNMTCEIKPVTIVIKSRQLIPATEKSTNQTSTEIANSGNSTPKITIESQITFEFKTEAAKKTFDFLIHAFEEDYMHRKFSLEKSGWRTLPDIIKHGRISKFSVYGDNHKKGKVIPQLEKRGLIEIRVFPGERGRGGKIMKARVCYEREPVKHLIEQRIVKNN